MQAFAKFVISKQQTSPSFFSFQSVSNAASLPTSSVFSTLTFLSLQTSSSFALATAAMLTAKVAVSP